MMLFAAPIRHVLPCLFTLGLILGCASPPNSGAEVADTAVPASARPLGAPDRSPQLSRPSDLTPDAASEARIYTPPAPESAISIERIFHGPTAPRALDHVCPEWEKCAYLVLALSSDCLERPNIAEFYRNLIRAAAKYTEVVLLFNDSDLQETTSFIAAFDNEPAIRPRLKLLPSRIDTKWVRDYGPVCAVDRQGRLCMLDARYRDVREEERMQRGLNSSLAAMRLRGDRSGAGVLESRATEDIGGEPTVVAMLSDIIKAQITRNEDDAAPIYFAQLLMREGEDAVSIIRPPVQLWGGDFYTDGNGNSFTSTNTLLMNGGSRDMLEQIFKQYYGTKTVTYLEPLPGQTIKHIDMFFKVADANTFLLAQYRPSEGDLPPYKKFIEREIREVLDRNYALLSKRFPQKRIIRVPMPALTLQLPPSTVSEMKLSLFREYLEEDENQSPLQMLLKRLSKSREETEPQEAEANEDGREEKEIPADQNDAQAVQSDDKPSEELKPDDAPTDDLRQKLLIRAIALGSVEAAITEAALEKYRKTALEDKDDPRAEDELFHKLFRRRMDMPLEQFVEERPKDAQWVYRTYLNSVHIHGDRGDAVLVPRYAGLKEVEPWVQNAYEQAYPGAKIEFIASDEVIGEYGAIHCVTCTVPRIPK